MAASSASHSGGRAEAVEPAGQRTPFTHLTIGGLVVLHFLLGLLVTLPRRSEIWQIPVLTAAGAFYGRHRLDQSWSMFAPPPRVDTEIQYAVRFADGWTELVSLEGFATRQIKGTLVQPRGVFRLATFLRATSSDQLPSGLAGDGGRLFYYQQLADFFCAGDGRIPGAAAIRFYVVGHHAPYFFATDPYGLPEPPITDYEFQQPLYEQACSQL